MTDELKCPKCGGTKFYYKFLGNLNIDTKTKEIYTDEDFDYDRGWKCENCTDTMENDLSDKIEEVYSKVELEQSRTEYK